MTRFREEYYATAAHKNWAKAKQAGVPAALQGPSRSAVRAEYFRKSHKGFHKVPAWKRLDGL